MRGAQKEKVCKGCGELFRAKKTPVYGNKENHNRYCKKCISERNWNYKLDLIGIYGSKGNKV